MSEPILSIGIPTWNRAEFLEKMLRSVSSQAERFHCANKVEIVVSDNASSDDTPAVVERARTQTAVAIRYNRNEENVGTVRNIFKTAELASGRYWMFYGDDDLVVEGALPKLIDLMERRGDVVAFIFNNITIVGERSTFLPAFERLSAEEAARRYFHYMGNAGVFALRTDAAHDALRTWGNQMRSWWPQTELLFAGAALAGGREPLAVASIDATDSPNHEKNVAYTSWYIWETMLHSLYVAARELKPIAGPAVYEAARDHLFAPRRVVSLAGSVLLYTTLFDRPAELQRTRRESFQALFETDFRTFFPMFLVWAIAALPRFVRLPLLWTGVALRWPHQIRRRIRWIHEKQAKYHEKRARVEAGKTRIYTPADL